MARGTFWLTFFVFSMLHLLDLTGFDCPRYLPPYSPETFADLLCHRLHIVGLEVAGKRRQDGLAGRCRVGIGHCDALRSLPVQYVENVVVVDGYDADDGHRHIEVGIGTLHALLDRTGIHQPQGRQHHRDAQETPGKAVRAGGVAVTVLDRCLCEQFFSFFRCRR